MGKLKEKYRSTYTLETETGNDQVYVSQGIIQERKLNLMTDTNRNELGVNQKMSTVHGFLSSKQAINYRNHQASELLIYTKINSNF